MVTKTFKRVRLFGSNNEHIDKDHLYLIPEWENLHEYDERIILNRNNYAPIFKKEFSIDTYRPSKRGIVKIRNGKNTIYRFFYAKRIDEQTSGLTQLSMLQLDLKEEQNNLELSRATLFGKFMFYNEHPFHEVRVSFKLAVYFGIISILLGLLSILLAIIPILLQP